MKTILSFILSFVFFINLASSQHVIATSGGYFENENFSVSFTIGEPVIETFTGNNFSLTQGFQQPFSFYLYQILEIPVGWSGISSYLDPTNKNVSGIFSENQNQLIILASQNGIYFPMQGVNTIGNWNFQTGYKIKAAEDFELTVKGSKISEPSLELSEGWTLLPVLSSCEVNVEDLFADTDALLFIKEVAGTNVYWPQFGINTLQYLLPGRAYFVALDELTSITFPACLQAKAAKNPAKATSFHTQWNMLHFSANSHTIAIPSSKINEAGLLPGDVIGAFTPEGFCGGFEKVDDLSQNIAITTFAKDEIDLNSEGFRDGEAFHFKVYRNTESKEFDLVVDFDLAMPNAGYFANNGLSAISSMKLQPNDSADESTFNARIYPNPTKGQFNLVMSFWPDLTIVTIMDARGSILENFTFDGTTGQSTQQFDVSHFPKGVYVVKISGGGLSEVRQLVTY